MLEIHIPSTGIFKVDYEEHEGYVIDIFNICHMKEGRLYREIEEPSRKLYAALVDAVQYHLDCN